MTKILPILPFNNFQNNFSVGSPERRNSAQISRGENNLNAERLFAFKGANPATTVNPSQQTQRQNPQIANYMDKLAQMDNSNIANKANYNNMFVSFNGREGIAAQKLNLLA